MPGTPSSMQQITITATGPANVSANGSANGSAPGQSMLSTWRASSSLSHTMPDLKNNSSQQSTKLNSSFSFNGTLPEQKSDNTSQQITSLNISKPLNITVPGQSTNMTTSNMLNNTIPGQTYNNSTNRFISNGSMTANPGQNSTQQTMNMTLSSNMITTTKVPDSGAGVLASYTIATLEPTGPKKSKSGDYSLDHDYSLSSSVIKEHTTKPSNLSSTGESPLNKEHFPQVNTTIEEQSWIETQEVEPTAPGLAHNITVANKSDGKSVTVNSEGFSPVSQKTRDVSSLNTASPSGLNTTTVSKMSESTTISPKNGSSSSVAANPEAQKDKPLASITTEASKSAAQDGKSPTVNNPGSETKAETPESHSVGADEADQNSNFK